MQDKEIQECPQGYVWKENKKLRCGYTTGSCAAAAAKAALFTLLSGTVSDHVELMTPKGIRLYLEVEELEKGDGWASCGIRKDGGDDPDATHGLLIMAKVSRTEEPGIEIDGGPGVGRVTRKGLDQPPGAAAINRVPREMITREMEALLKEYGDLGGIKVEISVPEGEKTAEKTFNPRLGIVGGISILGTSGIVIPMSEAALIASIGIEMKQLLAEGNGYIVLSPGNYGESFSLNQYEIPGRYIVKTSNFIGESIDLAMEAGAKGILMIGHIGKFVKLAGGIMNTHSRNADARTELMAAHVIRCGGDAATAAKILECVTTDEALEVLKQAGMLKQVSKSLLEKILYYVERRGYGRLETGIVMYSNEYGLLGATKQVPDLLKKVKEYM
ncbi:cobalamin biosynthesis protein CbiD [Clostridium sp. chh4-2]|uniref:cobalt-precorrin-5B (C(1))-methyltransferase CbiD n=1 Tax=Clostridium sp. chh4-2 TaxID=2067550 RepID=UPI000CCF9C7B|nr:cobalt-precorrin-5B (C(1))-methyltransferase CbiD [Clostridium sp. chh4-2]PNV59919.1 cobalamin biosynthesis protein CbiD [Clostridium sp. chh4-2]